MAYFRSYTYTCKNGIHIVPCNGSRITFIWGMVGENQDFDDMDGVANQDLR